MATWCGETPNKAYRWRLWNGPRVFIFPVFFFPVAAKLSQTKVPYDIVQKCNVVGLAMGWRRISLLLSSMPTLSVGEGDIHLESYMRYLSSSFRTWSNQWCVLVLTLSIPCFKFCV